MEKKEELKRMDPLNPTNQPPVPPSQPSEPPLPSQPSQPVTPPIQPVEPPQPAPITGPSQPTSSSQPLPTQTPGLKILLVEDDIFLRDIYFEILSHEGFTVLTADDGEKGLKLGQDNPDAKIMLLDIMLPKMHGIDILKRLKSDSKTAELPIVILTNLTEEHVIQEALNAGAAGYLVKVKYTPPQVLEKVKEFIRFHHSHMA